MDKELEIKRIETLSRHTHVLMFKCGAMVYLYNRNSKVYFDYYFCDIKLYDKIKEVLSNFGIEPIE